MWLWERRQRGRHLCESQEGMGETVPPIRYFSSLLRAVQLRRFPYNFGGGNSTRATIKADDAAASSSSSSYSFLLSQHKQTNRFRSVRVPFLPSLPEKDLIRKELVAGVATVNKTVLPRGALLRRAALI